MSSILSAAAFSGVHPSPQNPSPGKLPIVLLLPKRYSD
jgi:hypothetical protein